MRSRGGLEAAPAWLSPEWRPRQLRPAPDPRGPGGRSWRRTTVTPGIALSTATQRRYRTASQGDELVVVESVGIVVVDGRRFVAAVSVARIVTRSGVARLGVGVGVESAIVVVPVPPLPIAAVSCSLTVARRGMVQVAGSVASKGSVSPEVSASVSVALPLDLILALTIPHLAVGSATVQASATPRGNLAASAIRVVPPIVAFAAELAAAPNHLPAINLDPAESAAVVRPVPQ